MAEAAPLRIGPEEPADFHSAILDTPGVQQFLYEAAEVLMDDVGGAVPDLQWAIALLVRGEVRNLASSSGRAMEIDTLQSLFEDGPARAAMASSEFVHMPDTALDARWSGYSAAVAGQGVGSVLSVPMIVEWDVRAALTIYRTPAHAFTSEDVVRALVAARRVTRICQILLKLGLRAGAVITQIPLSVIELDVWSLIREYGLTEETALQYLQAVVHHAAVSSTPAPAAGIAKVPSPSGPAPLPFD
jgi:hypothetical protein